MIYLLESNVALIPRAAVGQTRDLDNQDGADPAGLYQTQRLLASASVSKCPGLQLQVPVLAGLAQKDQIGIHTAHLIGSNMTIAQRGRGECK
ncbi:MAG: hypothetical protein HFF17_11940 [Oscillospiraceae bacterium]|nr:hypothetical protein [Oscillospiraceae bacterium]